MTEITLEDVSKYFDGGDIVANYKLNATIRDGEFLVILGPSGCGKTTALRLIAGLEKPSEGKIYFDDQRVDQLSPSNRNIAMVFQNYALYPHMTVRENIAYPLKIRDMPPAQRDERIEEITELLHIEDLLGKKPAELSGGQRQRTSLARAIVREPTVFLLDEPLSNLDAKLRLEMRSELKRIQDEIGITTIYVTHNQEEAMSMGDRVMVMNQGTIRQIAPPEELYKRPRTKWVANFIGSPAMNIIDGTAVNGTFELVNGDVVPLIADGVEGEASLGIRPENLSVTTVEPSTEHTLTGTVDTIEPLGEVTLVNVDVGGTIVRVKVPETDLERGEHVFVTYEQDSAYIYDDSGMLVGES